MPVSKISEVGLSASNAGGSRWMGQSSDALTGPPSSMASPSTLKMRPRVGSPTGTEMGAPVSVTSVPRARPSVVSSATARTLSSPSSC